MGGICREMVFTLLGSHLLSRAALLRQGGVLQPSSLKASAMAFVRSCTISLILDWLPTKRSGTVSSRSSYQAILGCRLNCSLQKTGLET